MIPKPYDFEPMTLGEHIKRERLKRGLLQKDVAALFKVNTFTVRHWETGFTKPQIKDVPALIAFLGYDPEPPNPLTVAEHLWAKRRLAGWSQKQAARHLGVDPCTFSNWECGGAIMKPKHRALVAHFAGLSQELMYKCMKTRWNDQHGKPTR